MFLLHLLWPLVIVSGSSFFGTFVTTFSLQFFFLNIIQIKVCLFFIYVIFQEESSFLF